MPAVGGRAEHRDHPAVKVYCSCGVRLDVIAYSDGRSPGASPELVTGYFGKNKDLAFHNASAARFLPRDTLERRYGAPPPVDHLSDAYNYRCRKCGRHWTVTHDRLLERVRRAIAAGRARLEFDADL